jgi:hypothetical protein
MHRRALCSATAVIVLNVIAAAMASDRPALWLIVLASNCFAGIVWRDCFERGAD